MVREQNIQKTRYGSLIGNRRRRRCHEDGENEVVCFNAHDARIPRGGGEIRISGKNRGEKYTQTTYSEIDLLVGEQS